MPNTKNVPISSLLVKAKSTGRLLGEFDDEAVDALTVALKKTEWVDQFAILESKLSVKQRLDLVKAGLIKARRTRPDLKKIMEAAGIPAPSTLQNPEVHHNLPFKFVEWFAAHGITDIHQARYMRWVEGTKPGLHQVWTPEFNRRWQAFIDAENITEVGNGYTQQQIFNLMDQLAGNPLFQ